MNAVRDEGPAPAASTVDDRNPWLGLASFTEETREYFYGREDEVAELARRVQRKLLTVLFGQSGLGKTSILRAGLVPRLRAQGYCPIYVRIDYARDAPEPAEQIKQAIARTARRSGQWTQVGVAVEGESLWEFLHHRDDVLRDESGATLIPLLIFDQFEEIFTLAQTDDFGRARASRFIADLADLVENRPPRELERRLEENDDAAERFDFARSDYRVLIALREDYLAPLEGLKGAMPSITQNRLRLAPMTGQQALTAVLRPGKGLVSEEVAAAIVRFVAGGAEIANAEVEPSLLSLICRELNDTRIAEGRAEISLDLLAGSHETILSNFYERSLADQRSAVRRIIEDELLTDSGFRENVAEEKLLGSFAAAGAAPDTLATLVNRRLLRIEERLDIRRVELTHDVLCSVVKRSRDLRHEREARDATERQLAEQRERELAARHALIRARQVAAFCVALAIGAVFAAGLAYVSTQRARRAEQRAEETRVLAEQARGQAEQLLAYLTDDFSAELDSVGRQDVIAELAKRQVDYFHALPAALQGPDTRRNGALAMVFYAGAERRLGHGDVARTVIAEALGLLEGLRAAGDRSERTTIGLARGKDVLATLYFEERNPKALDTELEGVALLRPVAEAPNATPAAKRAYVEALNALGYQQLRASKPDEGHRTVELAMQRALDAGARDLSRLDMAAEYAYGGGWDTEALSTLGRNDDARRVANDAIAMAERVLERRPTYMLALKSVALAATNAGLAAAGDMHAAEAVSYLKRAIDSSEGLARLDPGNGIIRFNLAVAQGLVGDADWALGRLHEATGWYQRSEKTILAIAMTDLQRATEGGRRRFEVASTIGDLPDPQTASLVSAMVADSQGTVERLRAHEPAQSMNMVVGECWLRNLKAAVAGIGQDLAQVRRLTDECLPRLGALRPQGPVDERRRNWMLYITQSQLGRFEYLLGDPAAAERTLREALAIRSRWEIENDGDQRDRAEVATFLSLALSAQGNAAEAARAVGAAVTLQRTLAARNRDDFTQRVQLALALYAEGLADRGRRGELLAEASALLAAVPAEAQALRSVRQWRSRVDAARQSGPATH